MNRPLHGPQNPTPVDHATDTYDTIDWLVKNIPESNGKVGILGISYDGFLPLMALVNPHPGAQSVGADEPDGRRLDGRRLVSQRSVSPAEYDLHLRTGSDPRQFRVSGGRPTLTTTTCTCRPVRQANSDDSAEWSRSDFGETDRTSGLRYILAGPGNGQDPCQTAAKGTGDAGPQPVGPGRHLRSHRPFTKRSSQRTQATTRCFW